MGGRGERHGDYHFPSHHSVLHTSGSDCTDAGVRAVGVQGTLHYVVHATLLALMVYWMLVPLPGSQDPGFHHSHCSLAVP